MAGRPLEGASVLVVDDQAEVLRVVGEMLGRSGARVVTALGGREALAALDQQGVELDVVLTDLNMPDVDGLAVAHAAKAQRPGRPVIALTGLVRDLAAGHAGGEPFDALLNKPCRIAVLTGTIAELLGRARAADGGGPA